MIMLSVCRLLHVCRCRCCMFADSHSNIQVYVPAGFDLCALQNVFISFLLPQKAALVVDVSMLRVAQAV